VRPGNLTAQRARLLDGEERRMQCCLVRDAEAIEQGKEIVGTRGHLLKTDQIERDPEPRVRLGIGAGKRYLSCKRWMRV
jgi:hypothetical protein